MSFDPRHPEVVMPFVERRLDDIQVSGQQLKERGPEMTVDQRCAAMDDLLNFERDVARSTIRNASGAPTSSEQAGISDPTERCMDNVCNGSAKGPFSKILGRLFTF